MIKFLRFENGDLLNVNDIKEIVKSVRLYETGVKRVLKASIEIQTSRGIFQIFNVRADAPMKEGESWNYASGGGERTVRNINEILDTMLVLLIDKMNDENEKIIDIDTRFLEEEMQAEVDRG